MDWKQNVAEGFLSHISHAAMHAVLAGETN